MKIVNSSYVQPLNSEGVIILFGDRRSNIILSDKEITKTVHSYSRSHEVRISAIRADYHLLQSALLSYVERRLVLHWKKWFGTNSVM